MKRTASVMSPALRKELEADLEYTRCSLVTYQHVFGPCGGRITREHAIIFAGNKVQEKWAIIPLCACHHAVDQYQDAGTLNKEVNVWVAVNRASEDILRMYSKAIDYIRIKGYLNGKFGIWVSPPIKQQVTKNTL